MSNNDMEIMKELREFGERMNELFEGKTPKLPSEMDEVYNCDIYIWRHPGMGNSKQIITGNTLSIATATCSYLEQLMRNGMFTEKELKNMLKMASDAVKGRLK